MIRSIFALIGFMVVLLYILGTFGVGHFIFYYGPEKKECVKASSIELKFEEKSK